MLMFEKYILPHVASGMDVLEIGPTKKRQWARERAAAHGLTPGWYFTDIRNFHADQPGFIRAVDEYRYDTERTFDLVFASQVIEHVRKPWVWVRELVRLTRPGGKVALLVPITFQYHESPVDCWRIYPEGMRALFQEAGLQEIVIEMATLDKRPLRGHLGGVPVELAAVGVRA